MELKSASTTTSQILVMLIHFIFNPKMRKTKAKERTQPLIRNTNQEIQSSLLNPRLESVRKEVLEH